MIPPRVLIAGNGDLGSRIADRLRATGASIRGAIPFDNLAVCASILVEVGEEDGSIRNFT